MSYSDPAALRPFVDKLTSRSDLAAAERQAVLNLPVQAAQISTNHDFVRMGERVDHACFIVTGMVGRFGQNRDGNRQITAVHVPTDMVDLHSVVVPEASSALQALAVSTVLRVPHTALRAVARDFPALAEAFWRECVVDAAILAEWVVNIGRRNSLSRMAHLFCEVAHRAGNTGRRDHFSFAFPANQGHIADMLGLTPVHVNRTLQLLRQLKVIRTWPGEIEILDWQELIAIGDFDVRYLHLQPMNGSAPNGVAVEN